MFQCEVKVENRENPEDKNRKPFAKLPITCPWKYKVPINTIENEIKSKKYPHNLRHENIRQQTSYMYKWNCGRNFERQYYTFLRLMQLFPYIHPASIHGILLIHNYDICRATEKLRRSLRFPTRSHRPTIRRNENMINYCGPRIVPLNNRYNYYRRIQPPRNCFNNQVPKPVVMVQDCYTRPKTYIKYDNIATNMYR